jgi:hypothetical protein
MDSTGSLQSRTVSRVIFWLVTLIIAYFALYAGVSYVAFFENPDSSTLKGIQAELHDMGAAGWNFVRPLLQLSIVLLLLAWALDRFNIKWDLSSLSSEQTVKGLLAVLIVVGLILSVLGGLGYTSELKDVALVVIGFYFGTNAPKTASKEVTTA